MKKFVFLFILITLASLSVQGQVTQDSLTLEWGASVNYGSYGQRTILVNDTLWHVGGRFFYGTPFGVGHWEQSFVEYRALSDSYWKETAVTTLYRYYGAAFVHDGMIYLLGGGGADPNAVEVFDPATRSVSLLEPMPAQHRNSGAVFHDGKIYMIAGSDEVGYSNRVDIYDIASNTWSTGADHPLQVQTEAAIHGGLIYTMGGYDGTVYDDIYTYDIASDSWTAAGNMPYPTSAHRMITHHDHIYVVGDYAEVDRLLRYSALDGNWVEYTSNFIGRRHASLEIAENRLYIVAGNSSRNGYWQYFNISQYIDLDGVVSVASTPVELPSTNKLAQNYPNPFNPSTSIRFILHETTPVEVSIFNLKGELIRTLSDRVFGPGEQELFWDGTDASGVRQASGQYLYTMKTSNGTESRKMVMLR